MDLARPQWHIRGASESGGEASHLGFSADLPLGKTNVPGDLDVPEQLQTPTERSETHTEQLKQLKTRTEQLEQLKRSAEQSQACEGPG